MWSGPFRFVLLHWKLSKSGCCSIYSGVWRNGVGGTTSSPFLTMMRTVTLARYTPWNVLRRWGGMPVGICPKGTCSRRIPRGATVARPYEEEPSYSPLARPPSFIRLISFPPVVVANTTVKLAMFRASSVEVKASREAISWPRRWATNVVK